MPDVPLPRSVTARAGTNIALVKYWGKRDAALNLPATGSLSLTLADLGTETRVRFADDAGDASGRDSVMLNGAPADEKVAARVRRLLDLVRARANITLPAEIVSTNSIPTAAGLASSASGFAALTVAACRAAGLTLSPAALSELARRGSGSAARSIFGGFVEMARGERTDGSDAIAHGLLDAGAWDLRLIAAITAVGAKAIGSTEAMDRTARTSPYFAAWKDAVGLDLHAARAALATRDLAALGQVAERSALRMHACAMAAEPPVIYWNAATLAAMRAVTNLRASGVDAYFTIDAGPHVKVLCAPAAAATVETALRAVPGVMQTLVAAPGPGATITEEITEETS